jgi:predicted MFS family arabinose efflux permease
VTASPEPAIFLSRAGVRRAALAGLSASLVGIGLARFAYTPLIPALVSAHWFSETAAAYLGAANLAGYLLGALLGRAATRWTHPAWVLRAMMLLTVASLFACELRAFGFAWFFLWRFVSGYTGGTIMVLAAPTVLARTPPHRRGLVAGAIFTGVGLGIVASATLIPRLLALAGLEAAWLGLGSLALVLSLVSWNGWPRDVQMPPIAFAAAPQQRLEVAAAALLVEYGLVAFGLVPHMIFLVVYVAHGLNRGLAAGAAYWVIYGASAAAGPLLAGRIADQIGFLRALRLGLFTEAVAVALPAFSSSPLSLTLSSIVAGAFTPGVVVLVLGRIHELVADPATQHKAWSYATTAFAAAQAAAAYGYAFLFARLDSYALLFAVGAGGLALALLLDFAAAAIRPSSRAAALGAPPLL